MAKPPVKRTLKDLFAPRDATETSRQGQGIGDIEAMRQMAGMVGKEVVSNLPFIEQGVAAKDFGEAAMGGDRLGMSLAALSAMPMGRIVGKVAKNMGPAAKEAAKPATDAVKNALIQAWHGSKSAVPFEKFGRDFYGKGAGGDRLGRATYGTDRFSETLDYLKSMFKGSPSEIVTQKGSVVPVPIDMASALKAGNSSLEELANKTAANLDAFSQSKPSRYKSIEKSRFERIERTQELLSNLQRILGEGVGEVRRPGTIYELGLDVDPKTLLNFDKDLIDQTPFVQDAVKSALNIGSSSNPRDLIKYRDMLNRGIRTPAGSQRLEDAGIQGVVGASQMTPQAKNYAIFNPDRAGILRVMGILGMLTGAGAAGKASQTPNTDKPRRF